MRREVISQLHKQSLGRPSPEPFGDDVVILRTLADSDPERLAAYASDPMLLEGNWIAGLAQPTQ